MRIKLIRLIVQIALIGSLFFPVMHQKGDVAITLTAIQAIFYGDYFIIGNLVIALVCVGIITHLISIVIDLVSDSISKRLEKPMNIVVNLSVILSFIWVTFLGTFLLWMGFVTIGLIIVSTYLRYIEQKKAE